MLRRDASSSLDAFQIFCLSVFASIAAAGMVWLPLRQLGRGCGGVRRSRNGERCLQAVQILEERVHAIGRHLVDPVAIGGLR